MPGDTPTVEEGTTGFVQIAAGKDTTCARTDKGEVLCWGDNAFTTTTMSAASVPAPARTSPRPVIGLSDVVDMDVAASHGCAANKAGEVLCWRDLTVDLLPAAKEVALQAMPIGLKDAAAVRGSVAAMPTFCVVHRDGTATCLSADRSTPPTDRKKLDGMSIDSIAPADLHTCVLSKAGNVHCWGSNFAGGLGQPGVSSRQSPRDAPAILEGATMVASGSALSCAVKDMKAFCWGSSNFGQAGAPADSVEKPTEVPRITGVRRVQPGVYHTCAVVDAGQVRCWGDNRFGQLGSPGATVGGIEGATEVAVGEWHSCALLKSGAIRCWGRNHRGQLGDGSATDSRTPRPVVVKGH